MKMWEKWAHLWTGWDGVRSERGITVQRNVYFDIHKKLETIANKEKTHAQICAMHCVPTRAFNSPARSLSEHWHIVADVGNKVFMTNACRFPICPLGEIGKQQCGHHFACEITVAQKVVSVPWQSYFSKHTNWGPTKSKKHEKRKREAAFQFSFFLTYFREICW